MTTNDFWSNFHSVKSISTAYWFDITVEEVALVSNTIYHKLASQRYKTITLLIENIGKGRFALIAILSTRKLTRNEILKSIEEIPHGKETLSKDGGV